MRTFFTPSRRRASGAPQHARPAPGVRPGGRSGRDRACRNAERPVTKVRDVLTATGLVMHTGTRRRYPSRIRHHGSRPGHIEQCSTAESEPWTGCVIPPSPSCLDDRPPLPESRATFGRRSAIFDP